MEETMRKSLILALMAASGGASYGATVGSVGESVQKVDPAVWRWSVSSILDSQKQDSPSAKLQAVGVLDRSVFLRHERYSPLGVRDAGRSQ
jgi:hypothetical protein